MNQPISAPLTLPCGAVLPNRIAKAAMTEGVADRQLRATFRHVRLYRRWADSGAGLHLTGNVMVDRRVLERPGNVAIDIEHPPSVDSRARQALRDWARAATADGAHLWMQISHAGRQSPRYVCREPVGPSAVQLDLMGNYATPRALSEDEIREIIRRFAEVAAIARESGFTGVQVHGAHGYLISSFLSPVTNRREDAWGGSLPNRARLLLETVRAVRAKVGADFPVAVKLNSDDFRKGGFSAADCLQVVELLNPERIDLLELSGGNYEQPRLLGFEGVKDSAEPVRESTRQREAYFLDYAVAVRKVATMPLMVTGGFRTRRAMNATLDEDDCDVIGIARPFCVDPDSVAELLAGVRDELPRSEKRVRMAASGWRSPTSRWFLLRVINVLGATAWYYHQIFRLADGLKVQTRRGVLRSFFGHWWNEWTTAVRLRR